MVVAITGANGFVGQHIADYLEHEKYQKVVRITRQHTGDYEASMIRTEWMEGMDCIVHAAAVAHSGHRFSEQEITRIQRINADVPVMLAKAAAAAGVKRFIYISSAHVYGRSAQGTVNEDADTLPTNLYAACKMDAENRLVSMAEHTGLELIILRPPLIYGPGVKANFLKIITLVSLGIPLPLKAFKEQRSYCYVHNLSDAVFQCVRREDVWNDVYNIADTQPLSIDQLCEMIGNVAGNKAGLFFIPKSCITLLLVLLGKRHMIEALSKPLVLDTSSFSDTFAWQPPFTTYRGIEATLSWYKEHHP